MSDSDENEPSYRPKGNASADTEASTCGAFPFPKMKDHEVFEAIAKHLEVDDLALKIERMNALREVIHGLSPFKSEPVDFVRWELSDRVVANEYNPNKVAPPEMELLEVSIMNDGYTQPIVAWRTDEKTEVVDGFHRNRVGKESAVVRNRVKGYLPIVNIRNEQSDKNDRIASTIRHNRARGKHQVDAMSEIVIELKNRNWTNERVARELGMDQEEVLRLCQISGLEHLFSDRDFSKAWEAGEDDGYTDLTDEIPGEQVEMFRVPNTDVEGRIFHTYDKWECHAAGFYKPSMDGVTKQQGEEMYRSFLSDLQRFEDALIGVTNEWKHSCEHYLTNPAMNRIAWLGQASMCYATGVPSAYRGGFGLLTEEQKEQANELALKYLNKWLLSHGGQKLDMIEAAAIGRQIETY